MRKLSIFNRQRFRVYLLFSICIFLIMLVSGCGGGSDDSFSSEPSETGSAVFTIAWHGAPFIQASEGSLISAAAESVDCSLINNIICEVRDESDEPLTSKTFTNCYAGNGTIDNIPAGANRNFVILAEDYNDNILYYGVATGITITAGKTINVGAINTYYFVPTILSATAVSSSQISLSWSASASSAAAVNYNVFRNGVFVKSVSSTSTSDSGLNPITNYCYNVSAYDASGNGAAGYESIQSSQVCVETLPPPPSPPPTPNPMTWATEPYATSTSVISMEATPASDPNTPIAYQFDFVDSPTGGPGGTDSEWQSSRTYSDSGLGVNQQYGYRVRARDSEGSGTDYSFISYAYTLANMPGYPSGGPFSSVTYNSIRVTWTANGNPSGTEYYCENIDNGTNSGWTTNLYWDSVGLTCGTSYEFRVMARNGDGVVTSWRNLDNQITQGCAGFDFDSTNEEWRMVGLYDDGGLNSIPGFFSNNPALHTFIDGSPSAGSIGLGSGGFTFPNSPTGDTFIHWDLNSPNLSSNAQWQGMNSFSYRITGEYIYASKKIYVQAVLHVRKPDSTESYYTDFIFHEIPTESSGFWQTHTVNVLSMGMPAGTTILNINFRIFFEANSGHDGYVLVDHVVPTS